MITLAIAQVVLYVVAFIIGAKFFIMQKSPLYFRLLFYGVACFLLEELYYLVDYACNGAWPDTFSFATFGAGACYAFMFSANYGQFDSFVDDNSKGCIRARKLGYIAPALLILIYIVAGYHYISTTGNVAYVVLTVLCKLPAFFAAYYHLKHLLLPDVMHFVVDSLRPCNTACLCLIFIDILSDAFFAYGMETGYLLCETIVALVLIIVMLTAERGRLAWMT
ncbi:MAG: hypothetical protein Q4E99_00495 [Bacillota bacterium]|nr:hypothetical protein [Bacillota bacterium]